ncbi:histidinol dehydrogenase, partial [Candidatus Aerophobetes bacterium]|nr:histidinol dehydrogenase [Candidatus Aerophobetes bacterium]
LKLKDLPPREFERLINRGTFEVEKILPRVIPLIEKVRKEKDKAVIELTEKFDGVKLSSLVVSEKEKKEAFKKVSSHFVCAIEKMCRQVEDFHRHQFPSPFSFEKSSEMSSGEKSSEERYLLGEKFSPVKRAAIYVPGGKASYPSTAVMGCVPARLAGVEEIIVCSPPSAEGKMQAEVIVASSLAGATTLIKAGGAQAIAACAWGTESVPEVDFIAGPGNIFVSCAKIYLASLGKIGIDCFAGPSEVLIIADANAPFSFVAWDMLAQAEHDEDAWCILLTDSENLAFRVWEEIEKNVNFLERKKIASASLEKNGFILIVDKIEEAAGFANRFAPEHLEIITENPDKIMSLI